MNSMSMSEIVHELPEKRSVGDRDGFLARQNDKIDGERVLVEIDHKVTREIDRWYVVIVVGLKNDRLVGFRSEGYGVCEIGKPDSVDGA